MQATGWEKKTFLPHRTIVAPILELIKYRLQHTNFGIDRISAIIKHRLKTNSQAHLNAINVPWSMLLYCFGGEKCTAKTLRIESVDRAHGIDHTHSFILCHLPCLMQVTLLRTRDTISIEIRIQSCNFLRTTVFPFKLFVVAASFFLVFASCVSHNSAILIARVHLRCPFLCTFFFLLN